MQPVSDKEMIFSSTVTNSNNLGRLHDLISYLRIPCCSAVILFKPPNSLSSLLTFIKIFLHAWHWPKLFICIILCNAYPNPEEASTMNIPILYMRKLNPGDISQKLVERKFSVPKAFGHKHYFPASHMVDEMLRQACSRDILNFPRENFEM